MDTLSSAPQVSLEYLINPSQPTEILAYYNSSQQTVSIKDFFMKKMSSISIKGATNQAKFGKKVTLGDSLFGLAFHDYYIPTERSSLKWVSHNPTAAPSKEEPIQENKVFKLLSNGTLIVEIEGDEISFYQSFLEEEMKITGVLIPSYLSSEYGNEKTVRLGHKLFVKAFREVYCPSVRKDDIWQEETGQSNK